MRHIGNIESESAALIFSDYLYACGIENELEKGGNGSWKIWIHEDDRIEAASAHLAKFTSNPSDPEYAATANQAAGKRRHKQAAEEEFRRRVFDKAAPAAWPAPLAPATASLITISIAVYIYTLLDSGESIIQRLAIAPQEEYLAHKPLLTTAFQGEPWRLFTPIFLHFGPLHLFFNMWLLKDLGTAIEKQLSSLFLLMLVLSVALPSNVAQYFAGGHPAFGGMSGVVYGLFGYIWMQSRFNPFSGFHLDRQLVTMMIAWFAICLTGLVGPVANTCHAVGLAVGTGIGYASAHVRNRRQ